MASGRAEPLSTIEYSPLCPQTQRAQFTCGNAEIDKWFRGNAYRDHCASKHVVTCARFEDGDGALVGFYALSSVIEEARKLPEVRFFGFGGNKFFPCVQLVYLAVATPFQRQEQRYGSTIMGEVVRTFAEVGAIIGIPALILTPLDKEVAKFYETLGFERYDSGTRMWLPLQQAINAVTEAEGLADAEESSAAEAAPTD